MPAPTNFESESPLNGIPGLFNQHSYPSSERDKLDAHRRAMYILTQRSRPIPSKAERAAVLANSKPDNEEKNVEVLQGRILELQNQHNNDLQRLYDYHAGLIEDEETTMHIALDEEVAKSFTEPQRQDLQRLYKQHHTQIPPLSFFKDEDKEKNPTVSCVPTDWGVSFQRDLAHLQHTYLEGIQALQKRIADVKRERDEELVNIRRAMEQDEDMLASFVEHEKANKDIARREREKKEWEDRERIVPKNQEEWQARSMERQMRVARIVVMTANDPKREDLLKEVGWTEEDFKPLLESVSNDPTFGSLLDQKVDEYETYKTSDPRKR